jgi:hypothetical protein
MYSANTREHASEKARDRAKESHVSLISRVMSLLYHESCLAYNIAGARERKGKRSSERESVRASERERASKRVGESKLTNVWGTADLLAMT